MLINYNGRVAGDVARNLLLSFLINKTAEAAHINIVAGSHVAFNNVEERFYRCRYISFVDSGFFSDLIDYVSFSHGTIFRKVIRCF